MAINPLTVTRLAANIGLVGVLLAFGVAAVTGNAGGSFWTWMIGGVAITGAVAQFLVSMIWPKAIRPAWDEQVVASHKAALQFGYWTALCGFVILFGLTQFAGLDGGVAFLLMAPILAAAPSVWMIGAAMAGRAG